MTFDSKTRHGPGELADSVGTAARATLGALRRMAIKVTSKALWQVIGHRLLDGSRETRDAEVFYGIGIWARPKSSEKAEALVAFLGGASGAPVVVATRNEDARRAVEAVIGSLKEGEAILYGSSGLPFVHVKDDQTVEVRKAGGTAVALATLAELTALRDYVRNQFSSSAGHTHAVSGAVTTTIATVGSPGGAPTVSPATPTGTSVIKGQ